MEGGRERGRESGREGGRERGREGGRVGGWEEKGEGAVVFEVDWQGERGRTRFEATRRNLCASTQSPTDRCTLKPLVSSTALSDTNPVHRKAVGRGGCCAGKDGASKSRHLDPGECALHAYQFVIVRQPRV